MLVSARGRDPGLQICNTYSQALLHSRPFVLKLSYDVPGIWNEWVHREGAVASREWAGEFDALVTRSALVFKLLTHADARAIAAAPTTSLPETNSPPEEDRFEGREEGSTKESEARGSG